MVKNFVGASNEIKKLLEIVRKPDETLANYLAAEGIEWKFIPARSPNFGGLWEAAIKSCKYHLKRVVNGINLTYEELLTVTVQIERGPDNTCWSKVFRKEKYEPKRREIENFYCYVLKQKREEEAVGGCRTKRTGESSWRPRPRPRQENRPTQQDTGRKTDLWRTSDNVPICFHCGRPGPVTRYCRDRRHVFSVARQRRQLDQYER
ncbi:CCHC-type domain-containing protein [Trichonephila clavipes]|nr:CCHC-type domain-containing protein [Trichonephila clavipes]